MDKIELDLLKYNIGLDLVMYKIELGLFKDNMIRLIQR